MPSLPHETPPYGAAAEHKQEQSVFGETPEAFSDDESDGEEGEAPLVDAVGRQYTAPFATPAAGAPTPLLPVTTPLGGPSEGDASPAAVHRALGRTTALMFYLRLVMFVRRLRCSDHRVRTSLISRFVLPVLLLLVSLGLVLGGVFLPSYDSSVVFSIIGNADRSDPVMFDM